MAILLIIAALMGYAALSRVWNIYRNYQGAVKSGLPVVVCPLDTTSILHVVFQIPIRVIAKHTLPASLYDRVRLGVMGWEFADKGAIHERVGPAFILVTAGMCELWCADPTMAQIILARRKDFVLFPLSSKIMRFLGENILTSDGEVWARQRRIVAPNLNERISEIVWNESIAQSHQMADHLLNHAGGESRDTINCLRGIAINVLGQVGYGQPKPFQPMELPRDPKERMTYVEAISLCTELLIISALMPGWLLRLPFMPRVIRTVGAALKNLPGLTEDMLDQERQRQAMTSSEKKLYDQQAAAGVGGGSKTERDNLMSQLVRLSDQGRIGGISSSDKVGVGSGQYLTEDEIAGNLFIFTGAGFDTTANTMTYAVGLLAAYPDWQAWMQEELDHVLGGANEENGAGLDYATYFPKLNRCLAVMMETLRLFPAVIHIARSTQHDQTVTVRGRTHVIPGPCIVYISNPGLHYDRSVWGHDAHAFRPSRWLLSGAELGGDSQVTPAPRGSFLPWSGGPRVCPGQKMAQVEFVTVFATLFRRLKVEPAASGGRSLEEARRYLLELMQDSQIRLTLQMNKPEEFVLRWVER